jgi:hypothetical protein
VRRYPFSFLAENCLEAQVGIRLNTAGLSFWCLNKQLDDKTSEICLIDLQSFVFICPTVAMISVCLVSDQFRAIFRRHRSSLAKTRSTYDDDRRSNGQFAAKLAFSLLLERKWLL